MATTEPRRPAGARPAATGTATTPAGKASTHRVAKRAAATRSAPRPGRRPPLIGVCGASDATPANIRDAEAVGRLLAERGAVVICGGFDGVMCAAARGAGRGGGLSIGVLAGEEPDAAADEVTIALPTGLGELANAVLPRMVHGVVAIGQGYGTLTEVAHAIKLGRPVVSLDSWEIHPPGRPEQDGAIQPAGSPREAVDWLLGELNRAQRRRPGARRRSGENPRKQR